MKLNDLKNIWDKQKSEEQEDYSMPAIVNGIDQEIHSLEEDVRRRDTLEITVCIVLIIIFLATFFFVQSTWMRVGCGTIVFSCIYICYKLKTAQIEASKWDQSFDRPLDEHLLDELKQIRKQKKLLKNIAWWYIAPLTIGLVFLTIGSDTSLYFKIIYPALLLILGAVIWFWNQKTVQKKLDPIIRALEEALKMIDES